MFFHKNSTGDLDISSIQIYQNVSVYLDYEDSVVRNKKLVRKFSQTETSVSLRRPKFNYFRLYDFFSF